MRLLFFCLPNECHFSIVQECTLRVRYSGNRPPCISLCMSYNSDREADKVDFTLENGLVAEADLAGAQGWVREALHSVVGEISAHSV